MSVEENLVKILVDNKSALELTRNPVHHSRSKHIDTISLEIASKKGSLSLIT